MLVMASEARAVREWEMKRPAPHRRRQRTGTRRSWTRGGRGIAGPTIRQPGGGVEGCRARGVSKRPTRSNPQPSVCPRRDGRMDGAAPTWKNRRSEAAAAQTVMLPARSTRSSAITSTCGSGRAAASAASRWFGTRRLRPVAAAAAAASASACAGSLSLHVRSSSPSSVRSVCCTALSAPPSSELMDRWIGCWRAKFVVRGGIQQQPVPRFAFPHLRSSPVCDPGTPACAAAFPRLSIFPTAVRLRPADSPGKRCARRESAI